MLNISPVNYSMAYNKTKKTEKLNVETAGSMGKVNSQQMAYNLNFKGATIKNNIMQK